MHIPYVPKSHLLTHKFFLFVDSMMYDKDAGHRVFMEDVYENQMRIPGANWIESSRPWTNVVCK